MPRSTFLRLLAGGFLSFFVLAVQAQDSAQLALTVNWNQVDLVSRTTPTLQLVENPMVRPSSPIHAGTFQALHQLGADYVRYVPWFPYPKMAVAELKPPTATETFWDFTYLDSTMEALMKAQAGHSVVINFSTTPVWLWKTPAPVAYPENPYEVSWSYNQGTELRDTSCKQLAEYYARLFSWYTRGGFTDELGKYHASGHHYNIQYWEVLNEPDLEHNLSPRMYTKIYDAVVGRLKQISPRTKFIGISVAFNSNPEWFEYFLNPKNHQKGIPLDGISYHHYSTPSWPGEPAEYYAYTFYDRANGFLDKVRYIESIRKRLAPHCISTINEIGTIIGASTGKDIPAEYWNISGGLYAYIFLELTRIGIDVAGESQLVGYPSQYPDVSMMNWETGEPNPRYWVLKLIRDNFGPGDRLMSTGWKTLQGFQGVYPVAQAYSTAGGKKLLFINRQNKSISIRLPEGWDHTLSYSVDLGTGDQAPAAVDSKSGYITLQPYAVMVVAKK